MSTNPRTNYRSTLSANKFFTSYTWCLENWSLLRSYYIKGVTSPIFELNNSNVLSRCTLEIGRKHIMYQRETMVRINIIDKLEFLAMEASMSIVDENMKKLITVKLPKQEALVAGCIEAPLEIEWENGVKMSKYLQNDTLSLFFEITVADKMNSSALSTGKFNGIFSSGMHKKFKSMYENIEEFHDVTFDVGGTKFPAHKIVFATNSSVFRNYFAKPNVTSLNAIPITVTRAAVFEKFRKYMYTGEVDEPSLFARELKVLADMYKIVGLKKVCEMYI